MKRIDTKTEKPSERQIKFAEAIAEALDLQLPEFTKKAYGEFISEWKDDFYNDNHTKGER